MEKHDQKDPEKIRIQLQRNLKKEYKSHKDWILVMAECAALCFSLDQDQIYSWSEFIEQLKKDYQNILSDVEDQISSLSESSASQLIKKGLELTVDFQMKQKDRLFYYYLLAGEIRRVYPMIPVAQLENSNPEINMARIFIGLAGISSE